MNMYVDAPAKEESEDCFQRYDFAKRVASIATKTNSDKSLVIGIYGKWGEGKTSVLNFINKELAQEAIVLHFNPWYFSDEQQLLKAFFSSLAIAVSSDIKTGKEKLGKFLYDYGDSLGEVTQYIPKVGRGIKFLKSIGKKLSEITVDKQKERIDKIIKESNKQIVVFIDDIDRLDVNEIQSIFKLVKLVGDFPKTTYILSFDDEMVSAALSPKYGGSSLLSGYNFLEKIIQIPVKIPKATINALSSHTMSLLDNVFKNHSLNLNDEIYAQFIDVFSRLLLPQIQSPRVAIRYANAVSFSLPLLREEVNINDLLIIEGIKVIDPLLYEFLRAHGFSILNINNSFSNKNEDSNGIIKKICEDFILTYSDNRKNFTRNLLMVLFPQLDNVFNNNSFLDIDFKEHLLNKRMCCKKYFDRYFTYSVELGEMSESYFKNLLNELECTENVNDIVSTLEIGIAQYSAFTLISRFRMVVESLSTSQSKQLSQALTLIGHSFPLEQDIHFATTYAIAANLIACLFANIELSERMKCIYKSLMIAKTIDYAMEIHTCILNQRTNKNFVNMISDDDEMILKNIMLERFIDYLKDFEIFEITNDGNIWRLLTWWSESEKYNLKLKALLEDNLGKGDNPDFALKLLKVFTPTINSSTMSPNSKKSIRKSYKSGFFKENYFALKNVVSINVLNNNLKIEFGFTPFLGDLNEISDRDPITDPNLVSVFQRYYKDDCSQLKD